MDESVKAERTPKGGLGTSLEYSMSVWRVSTRLCFCVGTIRFSFPEDLFLFLYNRLALRLQHSKSTTLFRSVSVQILKKKKKHPYPCHIVAALCLYPRRGLPYKKEGGGRPTFQGLKKWFGIFQGVKPHKVPKLSLYLLGYWAEKIWQDIFVNQLIFSVKQELKR